MKRIFLFLLSAIFSSCAYTKKIVYTPNPKLPNSTGNKYSVAIAPFRHLVPLSKPPKAGKVLFIPFCPVVKGVSYLDDEILSIDTSVYADLNVSGLFGKTSLATWDAIGSDPGAYDVILTGDFYFDKRNSKITSYLVNMYAAIALGILPEIKDLSAGNELSIGKYLSGAMAGIILPMFLRTEFATRELAFKVKAVLPSAPNIVIWEQTITVKDSVKRAAFFGTGLHYKYAPPCFVKSTPRLYKRAFAQLRDSMRIALAPGGAIYNCVENYKKEQSRLAELKKKKEEEERKIAELETKRMTEVMTLVLEAEHTMKEGNYDAATDLWKKVLSLDSSNTVAREKLGMLKSNYLAMGNAELNRGDPESGRTYFEKVLAIDPFDDEAIMKLKMIGSLKEKTKGNDKKTK